MRFVDGAFESSDDNVRINAQYLPEPFEHCRQLMPGSRGGYPVLIEVRSDA